MISKMKYLAVIIMVGLMGLAGGFVTPASAAAPEGKPDGHINITRICILDCVGTPVEVIVEENVAIGDVVPVITGRKGFRANLIEDARAVDRTLDGRLPFFFTRLEDGGLYQFYFAQN